MLPEPRAGIAAANPCVDRIRLARQHAVDQRQRLLASVELDEQVGASKPDAGQIGLVRERALEGRDRLLATAELPQHIGTVLHGLHIVRP